MVYIFLASGFETVEALCPVDIMRRAGIEVTVVSLNKTVAVRSSLNVIVEADVAVKTLPSPEKVIEGLEAVVLPGGMPGAANLDADPVVNAYINAAAIAGKYVAAICAAPFILGKRGLLEGKKAVCYPGFEDKLEGASLVTDKKVVTDGKIITAKAMGASYEFGLELVRCLRGYGESEKIRDSIFY